MEVRKPSRRDLLLLAGAAALGASPLAAIAQTTRRTPSQILGPFYPVHKPLDQDADLSAIAGRRGRAAGQIIEVAGRVPSIRTSKATGF